MNTEAMLEKLEGFENSQNWLDKNIDLLRKKYLNKFIAVKDGKLVGLSDSLEKLERQLEKKGINSNFVLIQYIRTKDYELIL